MRPRDLAKFLAHAIPTRKPILIVGPPGGGKTAIVQQAAEACGADIIVSHPVVSDPTDAKGLPWPDRDGRTATFLPFGDLARAITAKRPTVWLLDDLGQASPTVQASFMQLLLARRVNDHILPNCVTFVAATNRRTDRAGVSGILEPVKSRFASIVELESNLEDWAEWYTASKGPFEVLSFLRFRTSLLHDFQPTADLTNSPSPRTWVNAASFIRAGLPPDIELAAIIGAIGKGAASEFIGFLRVVRELPPLEAIIANPMAETYQRDVGATTCFECGGAIEQGRCKICKTLATLTVPAIPPNTNPSARYAVTAGLAEAATIKTLPNILLYAQRMYLEAEGGEFSALMLRDMYRRDQSLARTQDWLQMTFGPLGHLVSGQDYSETETKRKPKR